ncbi:MAG: hypothetical protein ACOY90_08475 [Candidatus Zhuqueibacterota bacterium]
MKNRLVLLMPLVLFMLNCAGGIPSMEEPMQGKNLIIGSIIFENKGYENRNDVYFENLDVAIIGIYEENGKEKIFGKWTTTDKNGYFFLPNVPDGKYALKAFRINMSGQAYLTVANEFRSNVDNYKVWPTENIAFSGTFFETRPVNHVINLKHNYFTFYLNQEIRHGAYDKIDQFKAANGEVLSRPMIFQYVIDTYPQSGWNPTLKAILDTYEY